MHMHNPPHPGLVLREYLGGLAVTRAAAHLRITRVTLSRVLNGKAGISAAMADRLAVALDLELIVRGLAATRRQIAGQGASPGCTTCGARGRRGNRQYADLRMHQTVDAAADFLETRAGKAPGAGLTRFPRTAPKAAPDPEDEMR